MMRERYGRCKVLGRLTPEQSAQLREGWLMLRWSWSWLRHSPLTWLRCHVCAPGLVWRTLRLLWCCTVVAVFAEPPGDRWP